jgi:hypothetical protein
MASMNDVIKRNQPRMREFLEKIICTSDRPLLAFSDEMDPIEAAALQNARTRLLTHLYLHRNAIIPSLAAISWPSTANVTSDEYAATEGECEPKPKSIGDMLAQLLDSYRAHCPDWVGPLAKELMEWIQTNIAMKVTDDAKQRKKQVHDELLERFDRDHFTGLAKPVKPISRPSARLLRLLLYVLHFDRLSAAMHDLTHPHFSEIERQRAKELEEDLRLIKLKLNSETQAKRDLQLQILRGTGPSLGGWP